jgi:hypothetical protein
VRSLGVVCIVGAAAIATATSAAGQSCDQYAAFNRLPDRFEQIASGDLGKAELFVLTDGVCTCDNTPAVNRKLGKPAPQEINWSCHVATPDERRSD